MIKLIFITFLIFIDIFAHASEVSTFGRSPRGLLMGDAYTAIADDEFTLFYNPAILGRHKGFSFTALNPTISGINILAEPDKYNDIGSNPSDVYDSLAGTPIYLGINVSPGFKMGRFALSAIVNQETSISLRNPITPTLDLNHKYDRGFIMGYGSPLRNVNGGQLSVGFSAKYIQRESIRGSYYLLGTSLLDAMSQTEISDIIDELGRVKGSGWGFDTGFDYFKESGDQSYSLSLSILDIYTLLHTESNDDDLEVQPQPMQVNLGSAWQGTLGNGFDLTLSADIRSLEQEMEFMRRLRFGMEVGLSPAISLLTGINAADNYSYGVKAHLGILKLYAGFFRSEIGEQLGQVQSDRLLIYFSLFSFNFEP